MRRPSPAETYVRLLHLAETRATRALSKWLAEVAPTLTPWKGSLSFHARALARLVREARQNVGDAERATLEELVDSARQRLSEVADEAEKRRTTKVRLTFGPPEMTGLSVMEVEPPPSCPSDVMRLQEASVRWRFPDYIAWLTDGFAALREDDDAPHLAFSPLRLYPLGRYNEQLVAAIEEARICNARVAGSIVQAVADHLVQGVPARGHGHRFDVDLWRLYAKIGLDDPAAAIPRGYLRNVQRLGTGSRTNDDALVDAICSATCATVASPTAQAALFERLEASSPSLVAHAWLVVALLNEAQLDGALGALAADKTAARCRDLIRSLGDESDELFDGLIKDHRLNDDGREFFGRPIANGADLRVEVARLARGTRADDPRKFEQPEAKSLAETPLAAAVA